MSTPKDEIVPHAPPRDAGASLGARVLDGFDDPSLPPGVWNALVREGDADVVFLTWHWLRAWWRTLGRGVLLLTVAERDGEVVAIAPFYADTGMVFFVGSGASDLMDFIGDVSDPDVLDLLLRTARDAALAFVGFRLYSVLETSRTSARIRAASERLGLLCYEEGRWAAPVIDVAAGPDALRALADDRSLARPEHYFRRRGELVLRQCADDVSIAPHLEAFFEQHLSRRAVSGEHSRFADRRHRAFIEQLTRTAGETGWLQFSRLEWDGRPIAFEYGMLYHGTYYSGPCSAAADVAPRAPDGVLFRQLLLATLAAGVAIYDLGVGDESFKFRFATRLRHVHTWGLYPRELLRGLG